MPQRSAMRSTQTQAQSPSLPGQASRRLYSGRSLTALAATYVAGLILILADPTTWNSDASQSTASSTGVVESIGIIVLIGVTVAVAVIDWRGFVSVNGAITWGRMNGWQKWVLGYFFLCFSPLITPVYLVQAFNTYRREKQEEPLRRRVRVARLEADLGIMPATDGVCPSCGKPQQVGAEFCVYCGKPLVEKPKVCPACGATALPDARWCPTCRTPLSRVDRF